MAEEARLIVALGLKDGLSAGLGRASSQLSGFERNLGRVGRGIGQIGTGLDRALTRGAIVAGAALGGVVMAAANFEQSFAGIVKTVDEADLAAVGLSFDDLRESILKMSREIPITAVELARLGEAAGALGVNADDIDDFIRVTALLGETTDITADEAAAALGTLGNQLDLSGQDYERFADILVNLGNKGASTESQILSFAERIAAAGNQAGLSNEQILGFASAMASVGLESEAGGTAFSMTLNKLTLGIATGSDEVKAFAKVAGVSVKEFSNLFKKDASGALTLFLKNLGKLDRFEAARVLEQAGITGVRQTDAIFRLAQGYDVLSDSLAVASDKTKGLSIEAGKKFDTTLAKLEILKGSLTSAAIVIGDQLLPIINDLAKEFGDFLDKPETQAAIKEFGTNLASGIRGLISELKGTDFSGLISGMKIAATVAKGAFDLFNKLPPEIKALAIGALVVNKATGGAVGSIAKGLGNVLAGTLGSLVTGGGLLGRGSSAANPVWVASATGGVGGVGGLAGGRGLTGILAALGLAGIGLAIFTEVGTEISKNVNPTGFNFNQVAGASGNFSNPNGPDIFARKLADELGIPLDDVKRGISTSVNDLGLTFDQAVDKLRTDVKNLGPDRRTPNIPGPGKRHPKGWVAPVEPPVPHGFGPGGMPIKAVLPDTAFGTDTRVWTELPHITERLSSAVSVLREIKAQQALAADVNLTIPVNINLNASLIQSKILQLTKAAGRYAGKSIPI